MEFILETHCITLIECGWNAAFTILQFPLPITVNLHNSSAIFSSLKKLISASKLFISFFSQLLSFLYYEIKVSEHSRNSQV